MIIFNHVSTTIRPNIPASRDIDSAHVQIAIDLMNACRQDGRTSTHRIRGTSQSEYYHICGYNIPTRRRKLHVENYIESVNIVNNIQEFQYIPQHYNNIVNCYSHSTFLKSQWKAYVSKQTGVTETAKRLLTDSKKYTADHNRNIRPSLTKWKPLNPSDRSDDQSIVAAFSGATIPSSMVGTRSAPNKLI
ncbi:MAG: hypothetical protein EXX96DRAFT_376139 [Benjaminiella poitrasii]|nr:MAG: hypothetical protein EXX96DRAFT_376139 [Benjaminiella poitrasii]